MGWNRSAASIMEELRIGVDDLRKKSARTIFSQLHFLSPVKSGRYRSNHIVSIGSPSTAFDARRRDYERWYNEGMNLINSSPRGAKIYLQMNLPYGRKIEEGSSAQAPQGVYRRAYNQAKSS